MINCFNLLKASYITLFLFLLIPGTGYKHAVVEDMMNFKDAKEYCEKTFGGNLWSSGLWKTTEERRFKLTYHPRFCF